MTVVLENVTRVVGAVPHIIDVSLTLLTSLHKRWIAFLRSLDEPVFARRAFHPDWGPMRVDDLLQLYAWHGRHHVGHIKQLKARNKW